MFPLPFLLWTVVAVDGDMVAAEAVGVGDAWAVGAVDGDIDAVVEFGDVWLPPVERVDGDAWVSSVETVDGGDAPVVAPLVFIVVAMESKEIYSIHSWDRTV